MNCFHAPHTICCIVSLFINPQTDGGSHRRRVLRQIGYGQILKREAHSHWTIEPQAARTFLQALVLYPLPGNFELVNSHVML